MTTTSGRKTTDPTVRPKWSASSRLFERKAEGESTWPGRDEVDLDEGPTGMVHGPQATPPPLGRADADLNLNHDPDADAPAIEEVPLSELIRAKAGRAATELELPARPKPNAPPVQTDQTWGEDPLVSVMGHLAEGVHRLELGLYAVVAVQLLMVAAAAVIAFVYR